ncbi:MAG TPA: phosphatase PAP2 family protein, partial [Clostridia bacterium]|nr:phosphatase PAP2 family protein [Clostridia bacterium]
MAVQWKSWVEKGYGWARHQDLMVLILMFGVAVGLWAFFGLADQVREGDTKALDEQVIRALREPGNLADPIGPPWLEDVVRDITAMGSVTVLTLISAAVVGFVAIRRQYHALGFLLVAIVGGVLLNVLLKGLFDRPRPDLVPHLARVHSASFPSGHSLLSA